MTALRSIFAKDIERAINPVISSGSMDHWEEELEEYVITGEVNKNLNLLFDGEAYNGTQLQNTGVWISGNFGSGKSHLLKMLSILLENRRTSAGKSALDLFLSKCDEDKLLQGAIRKAVHDHPGESILFDLGMVAKDGKKGDPVLQSFIRVFNEHLGYDGHNPGIAQLERQLNDKGQLQAFQDAFLEITGKEWNEGRAAILLYKNEAQQAYERATGDTSTGNIVNEYTRNYDSFAVKDFVEMVRSYLAAKDKNFRVNFFVDEVGQFVANYSERLLTLQSIAVELATKCDGRAWLFVTSQEDVQTLSGKFADTANDGFSKIQGRFNVKIRLQSSDANEVIRRRLLAKNDEGKNELAALCAENSANFGTYFTFDGGHYTKLPRDTEEFADNWPLMPYQFDMIREVLSKFVSRNVFSGKFKTAGERTQLKIFSDALRQVAGRDVNTLISLDQIFDQLRPELNGQLMVAIDTAERNLQDPFELRVLKVLFLTRYINDVFSSSEHNVSILLMDRLGQNLGELQQLTRDALEALVRHKFARKEGPNYEFMSDEERELRDLIDMTAPSASELSKEMKSFLFEDILQQKTRLRCTYNGADYPCSQKIDGQTFGKEYPLSVNIITPLNANITTEDDLRKASMAPESRGALFVMLSEDAAVKGEFIEYEKIRIFSKEKRSSLNVEQTATLDLWSSKNLDRRKTCLEGLARLLNDAEVYHAGLPVELKGKSAGERILQGFQKVIDSYYPNLRMLPEGKNFSADDIAAVYDTIIPEAFQLEQAELEVLNSIRAIASTSVCNTKKLKDIYEQSPYGWSYEALFTMLASLHCRGKIDMSLHGDALDREEGKKVLSSPNARESLVFSPAPVYSAQSIGKLKDFLDDLGDARTFESERELFKAIHDRLKDIKKNIASMLRDSDRYSFIRKLEPLSAAIEEVVGKSPSACVDILTDELRDRILEDKEELFDPIGNFINNSANTRICSTADMFLKDVNLNQMPEGTNGEVTDLLNSPDLYKSGNVKKLEAALKQLQEKVAAFVEEERGKAAAEVESEMKQLTSDDRFDKLSKTDQEKLLSKPRELMVSLENNASVQNIRTVAKQFVGAGMDNLWAELDRMARPTPDPAAPQGKDAPNPPEKQIVYMKVEELLSTVHNSRPTITNEAELDAYLANVRSVLSRNLSKGICIRVKAK